MSSQGVLSLYGCHQSFLPLRTTAHIRLRWAIVPGGGPSQPYDGPPPRTRVFLWLRRSASSYGGLPLRTTVYLRVRRAAVRLRRTVVAGGKPSHAEKNRRTVAAVRLCLRRFFRGCDGLSPATAVRRTRRQSAVAGDGAP